MPVIRSWPPAPLVPAELRDLADEHRKLSTARNDAAQAVHALEGEHLDRAAQQADERALGQLVRKAPTKAHTLTDADSAVAKLKADREQAGRRLAAVDAALEQVGADAIAAAHGINRRALLDVLTASRERIVKASAELQEAQADAADAVQMVTWLRQLSGGNTGASWQSGGISLAVSVRPLTSGDIDAPVELARFAQLVEARIGEIEQRERANA
jgi:hypothetical protein